MKIALLIVAALIVAFFGYGAVQSSSPEGKERIKARDTIALCWKDHGIKSLDPATQRFVAGTCEELERRYETRFGRKP